MLQTAWQVVRVLRWLQFDFHVRTARFSFEDNVKFLVVYGTRDERDIKSLWGLMGHQLQAFVANNKIYIPVSDTFSVSKALEADD